MSKPWCRSPHRHPARYRRRKTTVLIVGEGRETEPNYFRGLQAERVVVEQFALTIKKGNGGTRLQIVERAVNFKRAPDAQYQQTWCVFDVETLNTDDAKKDFAKAVMLAKKNDICLACSNPSFEVWFLAHFTRSCKSFADGDAVIVELEKHWAKSFNKPYDKADRNSYPLLSKLTQQAIANARAVRETDHRGQRDLRKCNSATDVYRLVGKLLG